MFVRLGGCRFGGKSAGCKRRDGRRSIQIEIESSTSRRKEGTDAQSHIVPTSDRV